MQWSDDENTATLTVRAEPCQCGDSLTLLLRMLQGFSSHLSQSLLLTISDVCFSVGFDRLLWKVTWIIVYRQIWPALLSLWFQRKYFKCVVGALTCFCWALKEVIKPNIEFWDSQICGTWIKVKSIVTYLSIFKWHKNYSFFQRRAKKCVALTNIIKM